MARFADRRLQWIDIIGRFEANPSSHHIHDAFSFIGRLKDEGRSFWAKDPEQLLKWQEYCSVLWEFINNLSRRRDVEKQNLATTMREFIQEFEHSTGRMYQMLYGAVPNPDNDESLDRIFAWFDLVFRASTYALVSAWIPDKQESNSLRTTVNLTTGEVRQEGTRSEMKVPGKYRNSTKRL